MNQLTPKDEADFLALAREANSGVGASTLMGRYLQDDPRFQAYGVRDPSSTRLVAYILVQTTPPLAEIHDLYVLPDYRRRHLAFSLLQELIKTLADNFYMRLDLEVRESALPARKLYERLGFIQVGYRPHYYSSSSIHPENAVLLSLNLAKTAAL